MKSQKSLPSITVITAAVVVYLSSPVLANHLQSSPSKYGIAQNSKTDLEGALFKATINSINAYYVPGSNSRFINHEMWLHKDVNNGWVELGFTDGVLNELSTGYSGPHYGHFAAEGDRNSNGNVTYYAEERIFGPSTERNSTHQWHMQREGINKDNWALYINGVKRTVYYAPGPGKFHDVGLETNTIYSASLDWNERSFQYNHAGAWRFWGSGGLNVTSGAGITTV
ncbi:hypothetical protein [Coleofasciculus sp. H7-2]|uniref:hypothetical protein n=1 Tax=Coleofasciculus sp. H7-2 TaxID=3351545 RepID=UPI003670FBD8